MNNHSNVYTTLFLSIFWLSGATAADITLQSDWLQSENGSQGDTLGARVEMVDNETISNTTVLDISIPSQHYRQFDQIEVIDRETRQALDIHRKPLWIEDYEQGRHGLRLYLKRSPNLEFRLRLIDRE